MVPPGCTNVKTSVRPDSRPASAASAGRNPPRGPVQVCSAACDEGLCGDSPHIAVHRDDAAVSHELNLLLPWLNPSFDKSKSAVPVPLRPAGLLEAQINTRYGYAIAAQTPFEHSSYGAGKPLAPASRKSKPRAPRPSAGRWETHYSSVSGRAGPPLSSEPLEKRQVGSGWRSWPRAPSVRQRARKPAGYKARNRGNCRVRAAAEAGDSLPRRRKSNRPQPAGVCSAGGADGVDSDSVVGTGLEPFTLKSIIIPCR